MNLILAQLRTDLETNMTGRGIVKFFMGLQEIPAQDDLPIVMVFPLGTRQSHEGTVRDRAEYDIGIEIQVSLKQYFDNTNGQGDKLDALEALVNMVEERDADGDLKTTTIMGSVNNDITVNGKVLFTDNLEAIYDPYFTEGEFPTAKVRVTFTCFDRPNRI